MTVNCFASALISSVDLIPTHRVKTNLPPNFTAHSRLVATKSRGTKVKFNSNPNLMTFRFARRLFEEAELYMWNNRTNLFLRRRHGRRAVADKHQSNLLPT